MLKEKGHNYEKMVSWERFNGVDYKIDKSLFRCGVSRCGKIWSFERGEKKLTNNRGYRYTRVSYYDGSYLYMGVHRIVALYFIPNPEGKPWVNHKNGVKDDNRVENLEWTTIQENIQHAWDTGLSVARRGKDSPSYGRIPGSETRAKMAERKRGDRHPKFSGWYVTPKGRFGSCQLAADALGTYPNYVYRKCKKGVDGYSFEPGVRVEEPKRVAKVRPPVIPKIPKMKQEGWKRKTGVDHWRFGVKTDANTRKKQSNSKLGEKNPSFKGWIVTPLGRFTSCREAGEAYGVSAVTVFKRLKSEVKMAKLGWSFEGKGDVDN